MRTPGQIQAQTRRGLSVVFHRPLAPNTKNTPQQQAQGLKIAAIPAPPPSLAPNVVRATKDVAPMAASRPNAFLRAFAQLRESISSIFPTAITLGTAGVCLWCFLGSGICVSEEGTVNELVS